MTLLLNMASGHALSMANCKPQLGLVTPSPVRKFTPYKTPYIAPYKTPYNTLPADMIGTSDQTWLTG